MFVRNVEGNIIKINKNIFMNDKKFYHYLWKKKYNINFSKSEISFNTALISYIRGDRFFI